MASEFSSNPFGDAGGPQKLNPYSSSQFYEPPLLQAVKWKVRPPAILLLVVGALGMLVSVVSVILAIALHNPNAAANPSNPMAQFQDYTGPDAAAIQFLFFFLNLTIVVGAIQMIRIKIRPMGFVAAVLAMVNCGNVCCILGLPAGIWAIVILLQSDVARAFEENY